jgi:predicted small integral membrane protein
MSTMTIAPELVPGFEGDNDLERGSRRHLRLVPVQPVTPRSVPSRHSDVVAHQAGDLRDCARNDTASGIHGPALVVVQGGRAGVARLRITRRGRLLLTCLVAAVIGIGLVLAVRATVAQAGSGSAPAWQAEVQQVTVLPGQTLWEIAATSVPGADPRDVVLEIRELNGLTDSRIFAGQELLVPVH